MSIAAISARTVRVPLERPVRTSNLVIDAREFVIAEVRADGGAVGYGFGFTRDGLVAATIEHNLAPLLLGTDPLLNEHAWASMYGATRYLGRRGVVMRAISAVDIALWDLKGKLLGVPVWRLLGGHKRRVPAYVAGGYYGSATDPADVEREFRGYRDAGYRGAKLNLGGVARELDLERVAAARTGLGSEPSLAVDFNGVLTSASAAMRWARDLEAFDIAFLEEPFSMDDRRSIRGLARRSTVPVAMGEDESGRWAFAELLDLDAVDVLRHDATLVGGISEWTKVAGLALAHRLELFPHWFPEIHVHMAAAYPDCRGVEFIAPESGVMNLHQLLRAPLGHADGHTEPPDEPGLGIAWDWDAIDAATT